MSTSTVRLLDGTQHPETRCDHLGCVALASHVETVKWDTGNTRGVSFFALCSAHAAIASMEKHHPTDVTEYRLYRMAVTAQVADTAYVEGYAVVEG